MVGEVFGRLKVLKENGTLGKGNIAYKCLCSCGNIITVRGTSLRNGNTKSCGCLKKEKAKIYIELNGRSHHHLLRRKNE